MCARQGRAGSAVRPVDVVEEGVADGAVVIRGVAHSRLASTFALWHGNDTSCGVALLWVPAAGFFPDGRHHRKMPEQRLPPPGLPGRWRRNERSCR